MKPSKRDRHLRFELEVMEARQVLSASVAVAPWAHRAVDISTPFPLPPHKELLLNGQLSGNYSSRTFPDVGTSYTLSGQGQVQPLGRTSMTGSLQSLGFVLHGFADGTLTLSSSKESVTLHLMGPPQHGFAPLPNQFNYVILRGTGAFAQTMGRGTASLVLVPAETTNPLMHQGRFELHLVGIPIVRPEPDPSPI
jgi:hypothetical protein